MKAYKKDFIGMAQAINSVLVPYNVSLYDESTRKAVKAAFSDYITRLRWILERSNACYDHSKFVDACWKGVKKLD